MSNPAQLETPVTVQKSSRFPWLAIALIVLVIIASASTYIWYSLQRSCEVQSVKEASALLLILTKRFDDVYQVATNAFPTSIDPPVLTMQQILMDTQEVPVPACLQTARDELIDYMGTVIRALRAYAAQEANATIRDIVAQANQHYGNFFTELNAVKECAPLCFR